MEGYPALVVHGPLQATFLLTLAARLGGGEAPQHFGYRAVRPLFDGGTFGVNGSREGYQARLWVTDQAGAVTMTADARWTGG